MCSSCALHVLCQELCICYLEWSLKVQGFHWCQAPHHCGLSFSRCSCDFWINIISQSDLINFYKNLMSSFWFLYCKVIMERVIKNQKKSLTGIKGFPLHTNKQHTQCSTQEPLFISSCFGSKKPEFLVIFKLVLGLVFEGWMSSKVLLWSLADFSVTSLSWLARN